MMDSDTIGATEGAVTAHENGFSTEMVITAENGIVSDSLDVIVGETAKIDLGTESNFDTGRHSEELIEDQHLNMEVNHLASEEAHVENADNPEFTKAQKVQDKVKTKKPLGGKNVPSTLVKNTKDAKHVESKAAASNGSGGLNLQSKQSLKNRSFNDRQHHAAKPGKSGAEGIGDKTKLKPLKKGSHDKPEEDAESSASPKEGGDKHRRVGALPNYGFSFKCDQRAEKRKEFYSKLEEKIHAKEQEKNNMQEKSKETQEAELRRLRKSLNFKATPMPSFYQEPQPPKVELKKIPPTRPRSPKFGRKKTVATADSEQDTEQHSHPGRLSLDQKVSNSNPVVQGALPVDSKQPNRKSLPRLPSQKTTLSGIKNEGKTVPAKVAVSIKAKTEKRKTEKDGIAIDKSNLANESTISSSDQELFPATKPFEAQKNADESSGFVEEGKSPLVLEPVAIEH